MPLKRCRTNILTARIGILRLAIFGLILILTGCSSTNSSSASCDFVRGTAGNQSQREVSGDDSRSRDVRQMDVGIGTLTAIFGSISRALSSDDSSDKKCL